MKPIRFNRFSAIVTLAILPGCLFAADRVRNNTANNLVSDSAWTTTPAPGASDRAVWSSASVGGATTLGGNASWQGILVGSGTPTSGPLFTNAVNPPGFTLTLGFAGIDLNNGGSTNRGITFESNTAIGLGANQVWKLGNGQTSANIVAASVVSGASSLEITRSAGALNYAQLGGLNTFSGGLTIGSNAWLRLANSAAATTSLTTVTASPTGTTTLTLNEGALISSDGSTNRSIANTQINLLGNVTFNQATGGTGRIQMAGAWDLGGAPRTITINKPTTSFGSGQEGLGVIAPTGFTAPRFQNGALTIATTTGTATNPAIFRFSTSAFTSNGALTVGDGVAITSQNGSMFAAGVDAPALTLATAVAKGGGILQLGDGATTGVATMRSATVYSLNGGGSVSASNTTGTTSTGTLTVINGNNAEFSGSISQGGTGVIALTKSGAGAQTLSGSNSYTGPTTINGGSLVVNGNISTSSLTTVNTGGTLAGSGTVGSTSVLGGTFAPGNSIDDLNIVGDLTLGPDSFSNFEISAAGNLSDLAIVSALLSFGGTLNVSNVAGVLAAGNTFNLFDFAAKSGTFSTVNLPILSSGLGWNQDNLYTTGEISVIPEPEAALLGGLGLLVLLRRRR